MLTIPISGDSKKAAGKNSQGREVTKISFLCRTQSSKVTLQLKNLQRLLSLLPLPALSLPVFQQIKNSLKPAPSTLHFLKNVSRETFFFNKKSNLFINPTITNPIKAISPKIPI